MSILARDHAEFVDYLRPLSAHALCMSVCQTICSNLELAWSVDWLSILTCIDVLSLSYRHVLTVCAACIVWYFALAQKDSAGQLGVAFVFYVRLGHAHVVEPCSHEHFTLCASWGVGLSVWHVFHRSVAVQLQDAMANLGQGVSVAAAKVLAVESAVQALEAWCVHTCRAFASRDVGCIGWVSVA